MSRFICVAVSLVLIQRKVTIGTLINTQFQLICRFLTGILLHRTQRQYGSSFNKQGQTIQGSSSVNILLSLIPPSRPEIVPGWRCGQIDRPLRNTRCSNGSYQQVCAKHILIRLTEGLFIVPKIHQQRTHYGGAPTAHLPGFGVYVGKQAIPKIQHLLHIALHFSAILPGLCFTHVTMHPKDGAEGPPLEPTGQQVMVKFKPATICRWYSFQVPPISPDQLITP